MTRPRYIDPFTDTGFKIIFGTEGQSEEILMGFLNDLYEKTPGFERIEKLWYVSPEKSRKTNKGKTVLHDVMCQTVSSRKFILEMQRGRKDDFIYRSTYYTFRGVTDQITFSGKGSTKYKYLPVTAVYICDFNIKGIEPKLVAHFLLMDEDSHQVLTREVRASYIQLPQFNKKWEECINNFDKWIFILKNMHKLKEFPYPTRKDEVFARLERVASYAALSEGDRIAYEADLKWASEYEEEIATAKREAASEGRAEGRAEGLAEGRAEGLAEGRAEGLAEGRAEGLAEGEAIGKSKGEVEEKLRIAKNALNMGMQLDEISQLTGLSKVQIAELQ